MTDEQKKMEPLPEEDSFTEDFKAEVQKATEALAFKVAWLKEFIPGGPRKRKRYTTKGQGLRRSERRRQNKVARASRKRNRPHKKRRR